jgi:hypothetical protein
MAMACQAHRPAAGSPDWDKWSLGGILLPLGALRSSNMNNRHSAGRLIEKAALHTIQVELQEGYN